MGRMIPTGCDNQSVTEKWLLANRPFHRVWRGFCVIRDSAENERLIREYRKNPAVIREFRIGCEAGFSLSVVRDS